LYSRVPTATNVAPARGDTSIADKGDMSKQVMREEAERLVREALERKSISVKQGDTRIETRCGKCGALNRIKAPKGQARVEYSCKDCGHKQKTL
jgi:predicted RNA-binding Zn-ribbon protein involved in translation (DUF1610 family)